MEILIRYYLPSSLLSLLLQLSLQGTSGPLARPDAFLGARIGRYPTLESFRAEYDNYAESTVNPSGSEDPEIVGETLGERLSAEILAGSPLIQALPGHV
jgi:hypothetical protein